jgi:hypothetical protein
MTPPDEEPEGLPAPLSARIGPEDVSIVFDALLSAICAWDSPRGKVEAAEERERLARLAEALAIVARAYNATHQPLRAVHWHDQRVTNEPCPGERRPQEARARLCALLPHLAEHDVELLLRMAERLLAKPDASPATGTAGSRAALPDPGTPATPAPLPLVRMLSNPPVRAILENLAPYSEDAQAALRVARALDRARSQQEAGDTPLPSAAP